MEFCEGAWGGAGSGRTLVSPGGQVKPSEPLEWKWSCPSPHKDFIFLECHLGNVLEACAEGAGGSALVLGCVLRQV